MGDNDAVSARLDILHVGYADDRVASTVVLVRDGDVTAVIDPYGRVRQSIPRHQVDALPAQFAFRSDVTFYTAHGDVFGWGCAFLGL